MNKAGARGPLLLCAAVVLVLACGDDTEGPDCCLPSTKWPELTTRQAVLETLELSYNNRSIQRYESIVDGGFVMYFADVDVLLAKTPDQWGRADEINIHSRMFNPAYDGSQPRALGLHLDLKWEDGIVWQESQPASAPEETWYSGTVFYNVQLDIEPDIHLSNTAGTKAQFTVRRLSDGTWRLVEMRDLATGSAGTQSSSNGPDVSTWGQFKVMYQ